MKKTICILLAVSCIVLNSCFLYFFRNTSLGGWENVGEQYFPETDLNGFDITTHPTDGVFLVLRYMTSGAAMSGTIRAYNLTDGEWETIGSDISVDATGGGVAAGILDGTTLCVMPTTGALNIRTLESGSWTSLDTTDVATLAGTEDIDQLWISTAGFSEAGDLYLVIKNYTAEGDPLSVYSRVGGTWDRLGSEAEPFSGADYLHLGFDTDGSPLVLWTDSGEESGEIVAMHRWNGTTWNALAVFPETAGYPYSADHPLACAGGVLYCLVSEESGVSTINRLLAYEDGAWTPASDPPVSGADSSGSCLVPDGNGALLLSMEDSDAFDETTVLKYAPDTDSWEILGVRGFTFGDAAQYSVMTIGVDGDLYLAYQAVGHDNVAAVMSYPLGE